MFVIWLVCHTVKSIIDGFETILVTITATAGTETVNERWELALLLRYSKPGALIHRCTQVIKSDDFSINRVEIDVVIGTSVTKKSVKSQCIILDSIDDVTHATTYVDAHDDVGYGKIVRVVNDDCTSVAALSVHCSGCDNGGTRANGNHMTIVIDSSNFWVTAGPYYLIIFSIRGQNRSYESFFII